MEGDAQTPGSEKQPQRSGKDSDPEVYQGSVKLLIGADESIPGLIGFMKNLRKHPNLRFWQALSDENGAVEISIRLPIGDAPVIDDVVPFGYDES